MMASRPAAARAPEAGRRSTGRSRLKALYGGAAELPADRLIYEPLRLGILSALAVNDELSFSDIKAQFGTTDGNLSAHARKLEDAGYIRCSKSFEGRRPKTVYRLTAAGRRALHRYLDHMEAVIAATRGG